MHLKNIFAEQEFIEEATCKDFLHVQKEGARGAGKAQALQFGWGDFSRLPG